MSKKQEAARQIYYAEKAKAERSASTIESLSEDEIGRSIHWSGFKQSLKSAVAALIRFGMESGESRPTAHKIKNWEHSDKVFKYLLHARNAEVHPDEHADVVPNPVSEAELTIGNGAVSIVGGGTVSIVNCNFDGEFVNGNFSLVDGKPIIEAKTRARISYRPRQILMQDVKDLDGKVHRFPFDLVPEGVLPEVFSARHAIARLKAREEELFRKSWQA